MKKAHLLIGLICLACLSLTTSCSNGNGKGTVWDDDKTAGNYNSARSLWGNDNVSMDEMISPSSEDFIALNNEDLKAQFIDGAIPQPKSSPGDATSSLPGIGSFHSPTGSEISVFRNLYFNTDDHILRDKEYLAIIEKAATYLKAHPEVYIFVTGNCDERGPEEYNLALGSRRANYVRTKLVEKGVNPDRIHTISYGKERPVDVGHNSEAWSKNRRAEFKLYQRS